MLVMLSAALAYDATPDLVMGTAPRTGVSLRQAEGPWYDGTRYHFTRLTAELAPKNQRHVEPGLKVRGNALGFHVPSEGASYWGWGNPTFEVWLNFRPNDNAQIGLFAGGSVFYLSETYAYHVLPFETSSTGPLAGVHASGQAGPLELQQTVMVQQGPWHPFFAMSQTAIGGPVTDRLDVLATGTVSTYDQRVGAMARWQPVAWADVAVALDMPVQALGQEDTVPLDVVAEVRFHPERDDTVTSRGTPRQLMDGLKDFVQGR